METISINDLKNFEIDISLTNLVISLLTSIVCAYVIKIVYLKYAKTLNNKLEIVEKKGQSIIGAEKKKLLPTDKGIKVVDFLESLNLDSFQIIDRADLKKYPVSALIQKYLVAYNFE